MSNCKVLLRKLCTFLQNLNVLPLEACKNALAPACLFIKYLWGFFLNGFYMFWFCSESVPFFECFILFPQAYVFGLGSSKDVTRATCNVQPLVRPYCSITWRSPCPQFWVGQSSYIHHTQDHSKTFLSSTHKYFLSSPSSCIFLYA